MIGLDHSIATLAGGRPAARALASFDCTTGSLPAGLSLTRAGPAPQIGATGLFATVGADTARLARDPLSPVILGLLIEAAASNRLPYSHDLTQAAVWQSPNGLTISASAETSPDGTTNASMVSGSDGFLYALIPATPGETLTFSYYRKFGTASENRLAVYNQTALSFITSATPTTAYETDIHGNGWTRIAHVFTVPAGCTEIRVYPHRVDSMPAAAGTIHLWGLQVEQGSNASSPIHTSGAPATRAADIAALETLSGTYDVRLTYGDMSVGVLPDQGITPGWWPPLGKAQLRRIEVFSDGVLG
ncbi:hypothetical protein DL237_18760 [Pseudooceanicola sediminis]|uniref:Uncharacterized protein n=1 Tax=Pseudooceanicola sediminis TaxID=2211117 RepID=A0A399J2G0_9RHOB|nr:hypothetical protein [Pseudooceanicola sediminis]RII37126.1 hypothetical protein DL237_18760 [Pseudooceanicola sediminis]